MSSVQIKPGEQVIRKEGGRLYSSGGRSSAWLTLTNQRLIVETFLGGTSVYPLSRVAQVSQVEAPAALVSFKLLNVTFDNGDSIRFGLNSRVDFWINLVEEARRNAPNLPDEPMPEPRPAGPPLALLKILIGMLAASVICICFMAVAMSAVVFLVVLAPAGGP
jgi:hypothetical protein